MDTTSLLETMRESAMAVQAQVSTISRLDEAFQYAAKVTADQGGTTLAAVGWDPVQMDRIKAICEQVNPVSGQPDPVRIQVLELPLRPHGHAIHTSITPVDFGIAETGTLVVDSSSEDMRIATMLAEVHVAVLPASRIRPDSESIRMELEKRLETDTPYYGAFITGASRTADIERVLAIGVHGPQQLHILVWEEGDK